MHLSSSILSTTLCLAASVSALAQKQSRASPGLPPSLDPWYTAPDNLFSYPAGSIIKVRPDPLNLYAAIGTNATSASYNILYRTSDSNQMPSFAVTTLFVPAFRSSKKKNSALLSYQIPYNSPSVDASPSWTLGSQYSSTFGDITAALQQGWYVSVTDFEGPNATFAVGVAEGHAVLDGVRAVTQSPLSPASLSAAAPPPPPPLTNKWSISMWGYSGGSIATEFAAELQSSYAPDIAIAGVAIGGLTTPLLNVVDSVNESPYACLIVLGLWGYANTYPVVESYLLSRLTPEVQASGNFTMGRNMSFEEAVEPYYDVDVYSYFIGGGNGRTWAAGHADVCV
ncbi:hypothetical protein UA08_00102 [Talaromyces atroroseus]|uniref:LIP-domain-containing protein n=1 Tax=Talaromyces atroroseus TaxID=1441469 RepID=A0A225AQZ8_TALAT|nr:hypothetical protein UA08_00102 [Talaromyces atroroseus]OKL64032.1 hypothetical protein UA08_00102 [Talaromyces atroroseus]